MSKNKESLIRMEGDTDYSLSEKDTLIDRNMYHTPRPVVHVVLPKPKKTHLERLPFSDTTSAGMRIIRRVPVECLPEYFEQTCDRRQHETAVIYGSSQFTYLELDHSANRLAHLLISRGIGKGHRVGVLLERSLDIYIALLGVLKAGAVFVPLDPSCPSDQLAFIAEDAGMRDMVTTSAFRGKASSLSCSVLELDQSSEMLSVQYETRPQVRVDPTSLCYIVYTFGKTDRPTGVAISHTNIVNFLRVVTPIYRMTRHDRVYQGMSIAFDFSFVEIWLTWIAGATLVTHNAGFQGFGQGLTEFLLKNKITVLCCEPKLLATIESDVPSLRTLLIVGGACPANLVSRWLRPERRMLNSYGRITPSGEIEYLGRHEDQVKFNSNRIELEALYEANTSPLVAIARDQIAVLEDGTSVSPFEAEVKTSKKNLASRLNLKNVYTQVMTDPLYRNSIFNMASTFVLGGSGFIFWIIIARLYKAENVGIATTLISIMTLLSSLTIMGLDVSLNRFLPRSTNKNELINSSFVIVTITTILTSLIFLLGIHYFSPPLLFLRSNFFYIISFILFIIFCSWNTLIESIFMAFRAASNILLKNTIISIVKLVLLFVLIVFGAYGIFASTATAIALGVLVSLILLILKFKIKLSVAINIPLIQKTSLYSFANYMVNFVFTMPSLILPIIILNTLSAKYAAYFYVASMIQNILLIIPLATAQSLLTEGSYNEADLKNHVKKAISVLLIILIPITTLIVLFGNILLAVFGKNYATEAFQFLQLYSLSTIFTSFILISNAIMNIKHKMKTLAISNIVASALTLWLSCAFISNRLVGIGWGWILGQAVAGLVSIFIIITTIRVPKPRPSIEIGVD